MPFTTRAMARTIRRVSTTSAGTISVTPGYWTFTATVRPSRRTARCTCAREAADAELASKDSKCSSRSPSARPTILRMAAAGAAGTRSCNLDSSRTYGSGRRSGRADANWPIFKKPPRSFTAAPYRSLAPCSFAHTAARCRWRRFIIGCLALLTA